MFSLRGKTYINNDTVLITDIGEDAAALLCVTDREDCCKTTMTGEFYYPDGNIVMVRASSDSLYRNRGVGLIRLNRRNGATSPLGRYRCEIPDSHGVIRSIYINIGKHTYKVYWCHMYVASHFFIASTEHLTTCPPITCPECPPTSAPVPATCSSLTLPSSGNISGVYEGLGESYIHLRGTHLHNIHASSIKLSSFGMS